MNDKKFAKQLLQNGWSQKTFRIKKEYIEVCSFLDYYSMKNNIDRKIFFNDLFKYSLTDIMNNGFKYNIIPYEKRRVPKGFLMEEETYDDIKIYHKFVSNKLTQKLHVGEFIELLIYIYCINNIDEDLNVDWGIKKTTY